MDVVARVPSVAAAAPPLRTCAAVRRLRRSAAWLLVFVTAALLSVGTTVDRFARARERPVPLMPPDPLTALSDTRPVLVTMTTPAWKKIREVVTVDRLHTDHRLWRQMQIGDWDAVDGTYRQTALRAMLRAYADQFAGPAKWREMTADDWDSVPQPIRSIAYLRMIWYWARVENVGVAYGIPHELVAQTIGAIVMAESWFEHRAVNQNAWGNRDVGLAQCSDYCRAEIALMGERSEIVFRLEGSDYFNPWLATRIATVWLQRELRLADGDLDFATRAYHRGVDHALDERGDLYLARVQRLRDGYIRAQGPSQTWRLLVREMSSR